MKQLVAPGKMLISYGPVELSLIAYCKDKGADELVKMGAEMVPLLLKDLALYKNELKKNYKEINISGNLPEIVRQLFESVAAFKDPHFTPMVAVASTIAGMIADKMFERGATKVIVNNGGDIAVRLKKGETTRVGLAPSITEQKPTHFLDLIGENDIRGICTSGFGGRSFTKGIASAAIAFSHDNGLSDVAATMIGNHTFAPDKAITKVLAEKIDPETDLVGYKVTDSIGNISDETKKIALKNGLEKAQELKERNLIKGAVIFVQDYYGMIPSGIVKKLYI